MEHLEGVGTRRWFAVAVVLLGAFPGDAAAAASPDEDPPEFRNASESEVPGEADYWLSVVACPEFEGVTSVEPNFPVSAPGDRVTINCTYDDADGRPALGFALDWEKPNGEPEVHGFCGYTTGDLGMEHRIADPARSAFAQISVAGEGPVPAEVVAAVRQLFDDVVRPRARPCAPDPAPECIPIDGWLRMGFFGPKDTADWISNEGNDHAECRYVLPDPTTRSSQLTAVTHAVTAFKPGGADPSDVQRACSAGEWFRKGQGGFGTGGTHAISGTYDTNSVHPIDLDPFTAAAAEMVAELTPVAATCDGVELLPSDPYTPLPPFYAAVFDDEAAATPAPPVVDADPSPAEPVAATPATMPTTVPATMPTTTVDTPALARGTDEPGGTAGAWLFRVITIVALVLSILILLVTFWLVRRASRVRPRWDLVRIAIPIVVAVAMVAVLSVRAPVWAVAVAIVIGGAIGYWQGSQLVVELTDRGLVAKRSAWAIVAFTVGLAVTQLARLLDRSGAVTLGIAVTFLSAALAAGVHLGRRPLLAAAAGRGAGTTAAIAIGMTALALGLAAPDDSSAVAAVPDDGPDPAITAELTELIDWRTVTLEGGLWAGLGKPLTVIDVPDGLTTPPDPITRQVSWADQVNQGTSYALDETFSFSLRADGVCCSVDYLATGEKIRDGVATPIAFDARLADIQLIATEGVGVTDPDGNHVAGLPFTEVRPLRGPEGAVQCHRPVAETRSADVLAEQGGDVEVRVDDTDSIGTPGLELRLGTACDLPGFTLERALELAPEPPPPDADARRLKAVGNCPVYSEVIDALGTGVDVAGVSTATLGNVIFNGNANACEFGTLFGGPAVGQGGPGGTRHEFAFDLAQPRQGEWDRGYDRWWPDPDLIEPATIVSPPRDDVCEVDDRGVPLAPPGVEDGATCQLVTQHEVPGGQIWIATDYDLRDGPDTEIRAELPWGAFFYRCHHCEPGDPEIVDFLDRLVAFGNGAAANITYTETDPAGASDAPISDVDDPESDEPGGTAVDDGPASSDPARAQAEDLVDLVLDDDATDVEREAAVAAVIGLLGAAAMGATGLRDTGVGAGELWDRWRRTGTRGVDDLLAEREAERVAATAVVDEHGELLRPGDDGRYDWGDERLTRDEVEERIADQRAADAARQERIDSIVAEHDSDAAAAQRAADLRERTIAENDALMEEIRDGWAEVDRLEGVLAQRDAALAGLELAEADQELAAARTSWDQVTLDAIEGMERDVAGLPGEIVDATRVAVTEAADPENWRIAGETVAETVYDTLGVAAGNTFGDGAESIGNGVRFGGDVATALAEALVRDPVGTVAALTPIGDFAAAVDGERTLGQRLGSLGVGLADVAATLSGAGLAGAADDLLDAARVAEAGGDVARGAGRVLTPEMLRTRAGIEDALQAARAEAARRGVPVGQVLADMPEVRTLFQGSGMPAMGALEAAGGVTDDMAAAVVQMHDEITGRAIDLGTRNAIDEMTQLTGMRPREVLIGNSGSVGASRSVLTDADRTVVLVFPDDELDAWRASRGVSRADAQQALQDQFRDLHRRHAELTLNDPSDPAVVLARQEGIALDEAVARLQDAGTDDPAAAAVRLTGEQMDMQTYSGFGSLDGADDLYPAGFTQSRQSIQGSAQVYRVDPETGAVTSYPTSAQAIVDQHELNRLQATGGLTTSRTELGIEFSDPTRIPDSELPSLFDQQVQAIDHYDDVKSIAKAVDRLEYVASRTGTSMTDRTLVDAAVAIRANPRATADVLAGLGMTEQQFVQASQAMVRDFDPGFSP